jgi:hypothetical protein
MRFAQAIAFLLGILFFATSSHAWNKHGYLVDCTNAPAITIVPTYDSSFTGDAQYATLNSAVLAVVAELEATVFVNTQVNITYYAGSAASAECGGSSALSCSSINNCTTEPTYAQYVSALTANAKTATALSAIASLPGSDPHSGFTWYPTRAACKGLGLQPSDSSGDGSVFIGTATHNFIYPPSSVPSSGKYDAYGVTLHETTEAMGRQIFDGGANAYGILDEYQFSAANTRTTPYATRYYSTNNGVTPLINFNTNNQEDPMDWLSGGAQGADSFNTTYASGTIEPYSLTDQKVIDTLGYSAACGSSY